MKITKLATVASAQDGAIWGGYLFHFSTYGFCRVYCMDDIRNGGKVDAVSSFTLDKADVLAPHSNAVFFGSEYYSDGDEFPLLYSNIYNNFANSEDRLEGVCLVYRLVRSGNEFSSTLVQMIRIGFVEDRSLWKSCDTDVRPYGNFTADTKTGTLYAFVMRDACNTTRYFAFDMPKLSDGVYDEKYGIKIVTLGKADIRYHFDSDYSRFIQGACCRDGKIYSVEGFADPERVPAGIRIIDANKKFADLYINLAHLGYISEPEFIDCYDGTFYYIDGEGDVFCIDFSEY